MAWATPQDVIDSWIGGGAPDDLDQVQLWLDRAERMVRAKIPDLQGRLDAEAEAPGELTATVRDVVVAMVTRVYRNPLGLRSTMDTSGPYTKQATFGGDTPGTLFLTDEELAQLGGGQAGAAFAIDTWAAGYGTHAQICNLCFGAGYCSCGGNLTAGRGPLWELP